MSDTLKHINGHNPEQLNALKLIYVHGSPGTSCVCWAAVKRHARPPVACWVKNIFILLH